MTDEIRGPNDAVEGAPNGPAYGPGSSVVAPGIEAASPEEAVTQAASRTPRGFWRRLRRFFWMDERMGISLKQNYAPGKPGWEEYQLGCAAQTGASQLGELEEGGGAALLLDCASVRLMIRAHLARAGIELGPPPSGDEYWARLAELPVGGPLLAAVSEEQRELVTSMLGEQGEAVLAKLAPAKYKLAAHAMADLAKGLRDPIDRDVTAMGVALVVRWTRIVVALLVVVGGLAFAIDKVFTRPNLALHRPVTVVTPHREYGRDPSWLVDGDLTNLGFHTIEAPNQNVTIDLGKVQRISRVVVYNRADCCQERAVPLKIEISPDNRQFRQVAERKQQFEKWKADFPPGNARYVRLTDLNSAAFHLSEVEVY